MVLGGDRGPWHHVAIVTSKMINKLELFFNLQENKHSVVSIFKIVLAMGVFVCVVALVYSIIFRWDPWSALHFVTMTTFANGNIGDLVPEVIFYHII